MSILFRLNKNKKNSQKGFTLVELLVALGLFGVVTLMGISAILVVIAANLKSESNASILSNLDAGLEQMARSIRTGALYQCSTDGNFIQNGGAIDCLPPNNPGIGVEFSGSNNFAAGVQPNTANQYIFVPSLGVIRQGGSAGNSPISSNITPNQVFIQSTKFFVKSTDPTRQPFVIMVLSGYIDNGPKGKVPFNIQTTMSQRIIQ